jgi:hypothetical protein
VKKTLYIHIGTEKTGSTTIQECLYKNREILYKNEIYYLNSPGKIDSRNIATYCMDDAVIDDHVIQLGIKDTAGRNNWKKEFLKELKTNLDNLPPSITKVVVSSEHLHSRLHNISNIELLKSIFSPYFDVIKIIVYLRRQDLVAVSLYSTACKAGEYRSEVFPQQSIHSEQYFKYEELINMWSRVFGKDNILARVFEKKYFFNNNLVDDFFHEISVDHKKLNLVIPENLNVSVTGTTQLVLSKFNKYFPAYNKQDYYLFNNGVKSLLIYELERLKLKDLDLPNRSDSIAFYNIYKSSNDRLAEEIFNRRSLFNEDFSKYPEIQDDKKLDVEVIDSIFNTFLAQLGNYYLIPKRNSDYPTNKRRLDFRVAKKLIGIIIKRYKLDHNIFRKNN